MSQHSIVDIWSDLDSSMQEKLGKVSYSTFENAVKPISFFNNTLILGVPNNFMKNWVLEKCEVYIKKQLKNAFDIDAVLEINISDQLKNQLDQQIAKSDENKKVVSPEKIVKVEPMGGLNKPVKFTLNPKYSFNNFVVGPSNRFPHAASAAVAKAPGKAYNPLFLYGGVGLGKTHLVHAIGNKIQEDYKNLKIVYLTAEEFANDLISSLRNNTILDFRNRYRTADVILMDDIQFIAGKEKTEEEFFHTFNYLYQLDKQIVVTSDRLPKDIPSIEDRLRSRFDWGLSADLQSPELETRIAILQKKLEPQLLNVPQDVIYYIASQIPENVRELEGALIKIIAYASLVNQQININLAKDVIRDIVKDKKKKPISLSKIKRSVADYYDIELESLAAKIRTKEIAHARQVAMFLCRELTHFSLPKIGESFGNRDHTTVMHACDKIRNELKKNHDLKSAINQIKTILTE